MKAILCDKYGPPDVLQYAELARPMPTGRQVLIKVMAASLNAADSHIMRADPVLVRPMTGGWLKPRWRVLGADVAGRVEAVGPEAVRFKPGDEVYGDLMNSGLGGLAEYALAAETDLARKPANLTFEQAAAVPLAGVTALQALRTAGRLRPGQTVLINGASGGVGTYLVQLARVLGGQVTAVCSPAKLEMVRSLGAGRVIDYTRQDFTAEGQTYDLIVAANGYHPIRHYQRALAPGGRYIMAGGSAAQMYEALLLGSWLSLGGDRKLTVLSAHPNADDLAYLTELLETGQIAPVLDRRYALAEAAEAMRYLETGHARGKVIIHVAADPN